VGDALLIQVTHAYTHRGYAYEGGGATPTVPFQSIHTPNNWYSAQWCPGVPKPENKN